MQKKLRKNYLKHNELISSAMQKRRKLAYLAIAKICDIQVKIRVVK